MKYNRYQKRDAVKNYFSLPNEVSHVRRRDPVEPTQTGGMQARAVSRFASYLRYNGAGKRNRCENAVGDDRPRVSGNDAGHLQPHDQHDADAGGG